RERPGRRADFAALHFFVDARELAVVEPDAVALRALIDFDFLGVGEPFAVEHRARATRTRARTLGRAVEARALPDGVQRCRSAGAHALQLLAVEPDAAATAVAHVENDVPRALFAQRLL